MDVFIKIKSKGQEKVSPSGCEYESSQSLEGKKRTKWRYKTFLGCADPKLVVKKQGNSLGGTKVDIYTYFVLTK